MREIWPNHLNLFGFCCLTLSNCSKSASQPVNSISRSMSPIPINPYQNNESDPAQKSVPVNETSHINRSFCLYIFVYGWQCFVGCPGHDSIRPLHLRCFTWFSPYPVVESGQLTDWSAQFTMIEFVYSTPFISVTPMCQPAAGAQWSNAIWSCSQYSPAVWFHRIAFTLAYWLPSVQHGLSTHNHRWPAR